MWSNERFSIISTTICSMRARFSGASASSAHSPVAAAIMGTPRPRTRAQRLWFDHARPGWFSDGGPALMRNKSIWHAVAVALETEDGRLRLQLFQHQARSQLLAFVAQHL